MKHLLTLLILIAIAQGAEINGVLDLARITTPSAPPANFSRISTNVTTGTIACLNADSTNCFNVNASGAAAPTLPAATTFYTIGTSAGNSRELNIAYAGTSFFTNARFDGTPASPTAVQATEQIGGYNAFGYDGTSLGGPLASFRVIANQNFTGSAHGTYADVTTTPNGTTTAVAGMRWEASGGVTLPSTVTGGDKGAGSLNAQSLFVNNVAVLTAITGGTCTNQFVRAVSSAGAVTCNTVGLTADVTGTLPVGNGGTGTATAFTQGSVVFAGASGVYSQDNANLFWDVTNHRLGIGTVSPGFPLQIDMPANGGGFIVSTAGASRVYAQIGSGNGQMFLKNSSNAISIALDTSSVSYFANNNLLIGGTTDGNYRLDVQRSGSVGTFRIKDTTATTGFTRGLVDLGAADSASTVTFENKGTTKSAGYQSSDGSAGVTVSACTSFKNGLCVAGT